MATVVRWEMIRHADDGHDNDYGYDALDDDGHLLLKEIRVFGKRGELKVK